MTKNFVRHSRKVGQDWSVVAPDPLTMDGKSWRNVSLGDTLEEILLPKRPLTRRERMNLPDEVPPNHPLHAPRHLLPNYGQPQGSQGGEI